jgi:hypothetical protein
MFDIFIFIPLLYSFTFYQICFFMFLLKQFIHQVLYNFGLLKENQHFQYLLHGNTKGVKKVQHMFSLCNCLDVLNSNLKAETLHKHNNREKVQVFVCFIRFSSNVNGFNQVYETWLITTNWCNVT